MNKQNVSGENVSPDNVDQLAETLDKILQNPELKKSCRHKARHRFEENFMQTNMTSAFLDEYSHLVGHSRINANQ